jgi:hypothetical protein
MVDFGYIYLSLFVPLAERQAEATTTRGSRIKYTERRLMPLIFQVHMPPENAIAMQIRLERIEGNESMSLNLGEIHRLCRRTACTG